MKNRHAGRFVFIAIFLLPALLVFGIAAAQDAKGFDAKKRAFCKLMLERGQEAYKRGVYEKAGYYFQQAVKADASWIAKSWFEMKNGKGADKTIDKIAPQPPAGGEQWQGVIMGDDEGC